MTEEYDHPFPDDLVKDLARKEHGVSENDVHKALEGIHNELDWIKDEVDRNLRIEGLGYEKLREVSDEVYYAVPQSEWLEISGALAQPTFVEDDLPHQAGKVAKRVHDRYVDSQIDVSLGERYGLVLPND